MTDGELHSIISQCFQNNANYEFLFPKIQDAVSADDMYTKYLTQVSHLKCRSAYSGNPIRPQPQANHQDPRLEAHKVFSVDWELLVHAPDRSASSSLGRLSCAV